MIEPGFLLDLLLCLGLLGIAGSAVLSRGQFRATVLFMVFGLLMALTWARLQAPDLALAEAAIGAGLTGALLLNACKATYTRRQAGEAASQDDAPGTVFRLVAAGLSILLAAGLAWLMYSLTVADGPAAAMARSEGESHFLGNPVTVVLLDFRAYDTLLEMAVLLLALIGVHILIRHYRLPDLHPPAPVSPPMLTPLLTVATPLMLMAGLYLFWAGSQSPGGAFQSGALLAALGVLYRLTGRLVPTGTASPGLRLILVIGLALFSLFACAALIWSSAPLQYPETAAYSLVLLIEFALTLSIAATLLMLFSGSLGLARGQTS
ncbi:hydrogen gas-evolving membrane-bound hydrogenase subunit E [Gammaproteobacteria bacterium AB-CW1]|uniref:Hydrogen gas-evolving membrane-bound hydrogenase subunit E n=1 Tax=Natronospira elongata TaxID=3110268 RepID=A0AAP6JEH6_9GAMM|nr:hydrogen gas-evolving membrane-bound hydrogenase subunit E [Gammaproteobacteria bacterium AB-CW1]